MQVTPEPSKLHKVLELCEDFDYNDLNVVLDRVHELLEQEALASGDLDAALGSLFNTMFNQRTHQPSAPYVRDGIVYIAGGVQCSSKTKHRCWFVSHGGDWIWDSEATLATKRRTYDDKGSQRSVAAVPARNGDVFQLVECVASMGKHTRKKVTSYCVEDGRIVEGVGADGIDIPNNRD